MIICKVLVGAKSRLAIYSSVDGFTMNQQFLPKKNS